MSTTTTQSESISISNLASILSDDSSSDDESNAKKQKKNKNKQKRKQQQKKQQQQQQQQNVSTTSGTVKSISNTSGKMGNDGSDTVNNVNNNEKITPKVDSLGNTIQKGLKTAKFGFNKSSNGTNNDTALLQRQRKLRLLSFVYKAAQQDAIDFKKSRQDQPTETQQQMIDQLHSQHRQKVQKMANRSARLNAKKAQKYIRLDSLKIHSASMQHVTEIDRTSPDPFFLIFLKAYLANIDVSREWSMKRRLYSHKSGGNEKSNFFIPKYIESLNARHLVQRGGGKTMRQELADIARAKIGRHNIDYKQWDDAFYIHMPRVPFERLDNTHYEDKTEAEQYKHITPFDPLSYELQRALGMCSVNTISGNQSGGGGNNFENNNFENNNNNNNINIKAQTLSTIDIMPPWIPNMQRYGPPPAYPNAYIPGVNAPLPPGGRWAATTMSMQQQQSSSSTNQPGVAVPTTDVNNNVQYACTSVWGQPPVDYIAVAVGMEQSQQSQQTHQSQQQQQQQQQMQYISRPRWGGDLFNESPFMQNLQQYVIDTHKKLTLLQEKSEKKNKNDDLNFDENDNNNNDDDDDVNGASIPSLTGIWYPMSKIAPPNNDMNILLSTMTPIPKQTLASKFEQNNFDENNNNFQNCQKIFLDENNNNTQIMITNFGNLKLKTSTPLLFGAVDYVGFEKLLHQQMQEDYDNNNNNNNSNDNDMSMNNIMTGESHLTATTTSSMNTIPSNTTTTTTSSSSSTSIDDKETEEWRKKKRQEQMSAALPQHLQHIMGNTNSNNNKSSSLLSSNQHASVYGPQHTGELFVELDNSGNSLKRKGMVNDGDNTNTTNNNNNNDDYDNTTDHINKRQRQNY